MRKTLFKLAASCALIGSMAATSAFAQEEEKEAEGPLTVSGSVTAVSDYRFRGVSLSDREFAIQPTVTLTHESGLYLGAWASNIAENTGSDAELDFYAGFAGGEAITYDIGATYYVYPGVSSINYVEAIGKLGTTVGPATLGLQVAYVPEQDNTGDADNLYFGTNASIGIPNTPVKLLGSVGYEDGAFADKKIDWTLGLTAEVSGFTLGASYVDTNRNVLSATTENLGRKLSKAGLVFSISYGF